MTFLVNGTTKLIVITASILIFCASNLNGAFLEKKALLSPLTYTTPPANLTICQGEDLTIDLEINGVAPYTLAIQKTNLVTNITSNLDPIILNDLEELVLPTDSNTLYVITEITDSTPVTPCSITPMDSIEVSVQNSTTVTMLVDPYACLNDIAFIDFRFESFTGPTFDITYSIQEEGGILLNSTVNNISASSIASDSTHTQLVSFSFSTNTTFELISAVDAGNSCVTLIPEGVLEMQVAPIPTAEISGSSNLCEGEFLDMAIDLTGISPWSVTLNRPEIPMDTILTITETPFVYSDSEAGTYTLIEVTDAQGCTGDVSGSAELISLDLPTASMASDLKLCAGQPLEIPLNLTGVAPFDIEITDANSNLTSIQSGVNPGDSIFTVLAEGNYFISAVSDAQCANLQPSDAVFIEEVTVPEVAISAADFICNADSIALNINTTNGTEPFNFTIENTTTLETTELSGNNTSETVQIFTAGEYVVTQITDANQCIGMNSNSVIVTAEDSPNPDLGADFSVCSGTEHILGELLDPALAFSWSSDNPAILEPTAISQPEITLVNTNASDLLVEIYLEVTNGLCTSQDTLAITVHPAPVADAGPDLNVCFNEPVQLNAAADGTITWENNGNLSDYSISNPSLLTTEQTETLILTVESTSNPGCITTDSISVTVNPEITMALTHDNVVCFNQCDAQVNFSGTGGIGALTAVLKNSLGTEIPTANYGVLCADDYTATLIDENLCQCDSVFSVTELEPYEISEVTILNPVCFGEETGEITMAAEDALQYAILPNTPQSESTFTNLGAGSYEILVTNSDGCHADSIVELTSNPELLLTTNFSQENVCFGDDITFGASASGGSGDYTYNWLPNDAPFDTNANTVSLNVTESRVVQVFVQDNPALCSSDTVTMELILPPQINADLETDTLTICEGKKVFLDSNPTGGTGLLSCTWSSEGMVDINSCYAEVTPIQNTTYTVTVQDGCSEPVVEDFTVILNPRPEPEFTVNVTEGCMPLTVEFTNTSGFNPSNTCSWNLGDGSEAILSCDDFEYTFEEVGLFTPTLTMVSAQDCPATFSLESPIEVIGFPEVDFEWNPLTTLEPEAHFINQTAGGVSFDWESEDMFTSSEEHPSFTFPEEAAAIYEVCLTAENESGCESTECKMVEVESLVLVHVPTGFTPDGDGYNDVFIPISNGISETGYSFRIFSREGTTVFESTTPNEGWDGSFMGGDFFCPDGVYTWLVTVKDAKNIKKFTYRGHLNVLR